MSFLVNPHAFGTVAGGTVTYIGSTSASGSFPTLTLPTGTQVGDLVLIWYQSQLNGDYINIGGGDGGWTMTSPTDYAYPLIAYKFVTAGDVSGSLSITGTPALSRLVSVATYRGATTITSKGSARTTSSLPTVTGFTKASSTSSVIGVLTIQFSGSPNPTSPTGFTGRVAIQGGGNNELHRLADMLNGTYTNGTNIFWTNSTGVNDAAQFIFELT